MDMDMDAERDSLPVARLGGPPNQANIEHILVPWLAADRDVFSQFIQIDLAHTVMLAEQGILTPEQAAKILIVLREIESLGPECFPIDPKYDTFLLQVEHYMTERIGEDVAGRMHTGRSRNDQGSAVDRLYARDRLLDVLDALLALQDTVLRLGAEHTETLMPGYTHLQHAQPTTFGHHLMRHYYTFERDQQRLESAYGRVNLNALGGAAMAGTSWPLDRHRTADLLGNDGLVMNSYDVGTFDTDYPAELAAILSILVNNVGRLAGDFYLWSTYEFGMIEIDDGLAGTSSIMPQKKNPHALERIRGLAGLAIGWLPSYQGVLRNASSSDLTLAFAIDPLGEIAQATLSVLELMRVTLDNLTVKRDVMRERAGAFWSTASNLADELVRHTGISFRTAHHVVGRVVRNALAEGVRPTAVTAAMVDRAARETIGRELHVADEVIRRALDPEGFIYSRVTPGSVHPEAAKATIVDGQQRQASHRSWVVERRERLERARRQLDKAVDRVIESGRGSGQ